MRMFTGSYGTRLGSALLAFGFLSLAFTAVGYTIGSDLATSDRAATHTISK